MLNVLHAVCNSRSLAVSLEQFLSALLLYLCGGVRSKRQLMEQLDYYLGHRWPVGLSSDDAAWDTTTCTKNRERL